MRKTISNLLKINNYEILGKFYRRILVRSRIFVCIFYISICLNLGVFFQS